MIHLLIRLIINAISLWVAALVIPGINFSQHASVFDVLFVALLFGIINAIIKPILAFVTCPFYVITLGLFTFVVNALMLLLTSWLAGSIFVVRGFVWAFLGSIVISVISTLLTVFLVPREDTFDVE